MAWDRGRKNDEYISVFKNWWRWCTHAIEDIFNIAQFWNCCVRLLAVCICANHGLEKDISSPKNYNMMTSTRTPFPDNAVQLSMPVWLIRPLKMQYDVKFMTRLVRYQVSSQSLRLWWPCMKSLCQERVAASTYRTRTTNSCDYGDRKKAVRVVYSRTPTVHTAHARVGDQGRHRAGALSSPTAGGTAREVHLALGMFVHHAEWLLG